MTLEEFDRRMQEAHNLRVAGNKLLGQASQLENDTIQAAAIIWTNREPGFPCWTTEELGRYLSSPREVMEMLEKKESEK